MNDGVKAAHSEATPSPAPVMTPREIVSELDRYIVGQSDAKRAVAIALRNRWRRQLVPDDLREEIAPGRLEKICLDFPPGGMVDGKSRAVPRLGRADEVR